MRRILCVMSITSQFNYFLNRPVEIKKILGRGGGATKYEILSATMVGQRRKFFISNCLKGLGKLNIYRRQVI